ncbi:energy transducer TonB [Cellvibrio japonicus]|uniref:TonB family C-terminal domain protein n=1 Tax=Cellvibrio japonicus (strain Ueda107) TaxID=498211 RepID=B3PFG6_CELJU|nr:energy transducer TonB [Cellvibrio japonicus]ACE84532.1 TonB family C-terminal domain protein [Cellvibrio japonicus Ueda107]QEI10836.1 energy transducer TonB [Cellvibrio japonicus]QEI14412.1 energy transducer TonB [Cellvibrio japonicus]QEI17990.1 energy transducer TonB [Cellvibrio japonicus]
MEDVDLKPVVETGDRLSFTLFMALVIHGLILLGIDFKLPEHSNHSQTIEITLATHNALRAPDDADFLAQHNQEASGTIDEAKQLTTVKQAEFADTQVRDVNPIPQQQAAAIQQRDQQLVTTRGQSQFQAQIKPYPDEQEEREQIDGLVENQPMISAEIASLQAKLDQQRQEYARRPRIRTLTSVSTKASFDAKYLHDWSTRIEQVGTRHYPGEALRRHITGQLRLSVVINPDGSIYEVNILQSSGQRLLDDAARQIVRLASPFAAFPPEIRQHTDRLQIIRTWNFEISGGSSTITTSAN